MAAPTVTVYNISRDLLGKALLDLSTGNIGCLLTNSTYVPDIDTHDFLTSITGELVGNGYARQTLLYTTVTRWTRDNTADRSRLRSDNVQFTASGGSIVARRAVFFKDTGVASTSPLLFTVLLDSAPADVTAVDTQKLQLTCPANGWLEI